MINKTSTLKDILWFFIFFGIVAAVFRLWFGLGATTNLSDAVPWGLWKVLNMIAGVALSTCGFTIGFLAYVLKIEKFKLLVKPAILVAFLGYGSSCFALLFDIGLPHRFWHPLFMWNEHSFLFEVFWCVMLYFSITFIEMLPNILEKYKFKKSVGFFHKIAIGIVIIGISLSTLHHSSLGSLFLVTPIRLHELWYSSFLPLFFFISAAGCGIMFLILIKILYAKWYNPESVFGEYNNGKSNTVCSLNKNEINNSTKNYGKDMPMLSSLSIIGASLLAIYLILKIYDFFRLNLFNVLLTGTWESWLYIIELLLTAFIPVLLIFIKKSRRSPYGLGTAAFSASFGLALNRMDVGIFGYFRDAGKIYFPSLAEWALSIGVVSAAALMFLFVAENFSIFDDQWKENKISKRIFKAAFDSISRVWQTALHSSLHRVTLTGVFIIPMAFVLMYPPYKSNEKINVIPASGKNTTRSILIIHGSQTGMNTEFPHLKHRDMLGKDKSCNKCHHMSLPGDQSTPCFRCHRYMFGKTLIFDHDKHTTWVAQKKQISGLNPGNETCIICHLPDSTKNVNNTIACIECHKEDMNIVNDSTVSKHFLYTDSYLNAMHKKCINCHIENKKQVKKPKLDQCSNCHKNYYKKSGDENLLTLSKQVR
jgi:Ni/Fe-hydrogenase subunit HybB-like protein